MNVAFEDIVGSIQAIRELLPEKPKSPKFAYRMSKILRKLDSEARDIGVGQDALIKKYGEYDPKTSVWTVKRDDPAKWDEYLKELREYLKTSVEINIPKVSLDDLESEGIKPSIGLMSGLWFIFEEPTDGGNNDGNK